LQERLVEWRRELHRHPELGFEEHRTGDFVAARLAELGLEVRRGIAGTGLAAVLRAPERRGPAVLLRADMDALPVREVEGRPYGSTVDGRMHACGHDGHMAMLLGAAALLAERPADLERDVLFCFQPAEEGGGGAARMIEDGVLDLAEVGSAYALHLWTPFEAGTVHVRSGPIMAAQDEIHVRLIGAGGHGALPHEARDPIVAAANAVGALQAVVARAVDPLDAAVVTVGSFHAGSAPNIIPGEARLSGTLRSFRDPVRQRLRQRTREVFEGAARAGECELEFRLVEGYPATVNDASAVDRVRVAARGLWGEAAVIEPPPLPAAEDFAYFLREVPGAFVLLGAGNAERGITAPHHSAEFDIDESVLQRGAALLANLAVLP
jgi:amidohydrolase